MRTIFYPWGAQMAAYDNYGGEVYFEDGTIACKWNFANYGSGWARYRNGSRAVAWNIYNGDAYYENGQLAYMFGSSGLSKWDRDGTRVSDPDAEDFILNEYIRVFLGIGQHGLIIEVIANNVVIKMMIS